MITLLLLVLATDPMVDASASAMAAAAADGLGGEGRVELARVPSLPADADADLRATAAKADAVVEVSWPDADGLRAHVHAHLGGGAWLDRDLRFDPSSPAWERGRAVGLAIAAMVPVDATSGGAPAAVIVGAAPALPPAPASPHAAPAAPAATAATTMPTTPDAFVAPTDDATRSAPPGDTARSPTRFALGVFGELAPDLHGAGGGGRLDATWWISGRFGLRADGGARVSSLGDAVRVLQLDLGVGVAARLVGDPFGANLRLRGELRAARLAVTRSRPDGSQERLARMVPLAALFAEGALPVGSRLELALAVGVEVPLGATRLEVDDARFGALPAAYLVAELGGRWSF